MLGLLLNGSLTQHFRFSIRFAVHCNIQYTALPQGPLEHQTEAHFLSKGGGGDIPELLKGAPALVDA